MTNSNNLSDLNSLPIFFGRRNERYYYSQRKTGQFLELALGMNLSSADLDFEDGELKTNKCDKNGNRMNSIHNAN